MKTILTITLAIFLLAALILPLGTQVTRAQSGSVTFAVIGDYGMYNAAETNVANLVKSWNPEFVLATGDDYYSPAGGTGTGKYDNSTGRDYCQFLKDAAPGPNCATAGMDPTTNRFFPSLGNHDYTDSGLSIYESYFTLPGTGFTNSSGNERYYDYVWGPVHFFVLNSNSQEPNGITSTSAQATWLQTRLAASTAPWQVVYLHHPPYSSGANHGSTPALQWPFAAWGADAVISGHDHTYERIVRDGIVYLINGAGGASLYSFTTPVTGSVVRYNANYGAQRVIATNTTLDFEFYSIAGGSTLIDTYHLPAGVSTPTPPTPTFTATPDPATAISFQNGVAPTAGYAGTDDTTISQANPATNFGAAIDLLVDGDDPPSSGSDLTTLLRWNVQSIPAGSAVQSASLTVNIFNLSTNTYPVYEMKQAWVESEANWNQYAASGSWQASGAAGTADRGTTVLGNLIPSATGLYTLNLNASGVALVQSWVNSPSSNQGLVIANSTNTDGADFDSSEAITAANHPRLSIRYLHPVATPTDTPEPPTPTNTPLPPTPTNTPEPPTPTNTPVAELLYLSSSSGGTSGGVTFADEDILIYNRSTGAWSLFFDGSDVGLSGTDVDAFDLQSDGSLLLSFDSAVTISGLGSVADADIVRFTPSTTGATTTGTFSWFFDGSDVGLTQNAEDVDAIAFTSDGKLVVSTTGSFSVTGASGEDEDLLIFTGSFGSTTSGTWALHFDGSDVGLSEAAAEDINAVWIEAGKIYLSTLGNFAVSGMSGDASDIFICTPGSLGSTTTCTYGPGLFWDGSTSGFSGEDTDAFELFRKLT